MATRHKRALKQYIELSPREPLWLESLSSSPGPATHTVVLHEGAVSRSPAATPNLRRLSPASRSTPSTHTPSFAQSHPTRLLLQVITHTHLAASCSAALDAALVSSQPGQLGPRRASARARSRGAPRLRQIARALKQPGLTPPAVWRVGCSVRMCGVGCGGWCALCGVACSCVAVC